MRSTHSRVRPGRVAGVIVAAVLGLGACGGGDASDVASPPTTDATSTTSDTSVATTIATTTTVPPTTTPATTTPTTTDPATTTAPATTAPSPTAPTSTTPATTEPPVAGSCLVGDWIVTEAELNAFYDAVEARIDQPTAFTISGHAGLVFTETTYAWNPAYTLELDLAGTVGRGDAGGSITGTYTATDGIVSTAVEESAMTLLIDIGGQTIDGSELGNGFITSVPFASSPYTCDGPSPVIQFETVDDRHPVTLTPAG